MVDEEQPIKVFVIEWSWNFFLLLVFHFKLILDLYVVCLQLFLTSDKLVRKILPDNGSISYMDDDEEREKKNSTGVVFLLQVGFLFQPLFG